MAAPENLTIRRIERQTLPSITVKVTQRRLVTLSSVMHLTP
jgi:hypothetical protein